MTLDDTFGQVQGKTLERGFKANFEPCMLNSREQPVYGTWVFPTNDAATKRYESLAALIKPVKDVLAKLKSPIFDLEKIGYYPTVFSLDGKTISYEVGDMFSDEKALGYFKNLGYNRFGLLQGGEQPATVGPNHIISCLQQGMLGISKLEFYDGKPFPYTMGRPPVLTTGKGEKIETPDHPEYREFVGRLLERAEAVRVNPRLFGSFDNYQFYQFGDKHIAYNPEYGEGTYIVDDFKLFFTKSKGELRDPRLGKYIPRFPGTNWQSKIWSLLGF